MRQWGIQKKNGRQKGGKLTITAIVLLWRTDKDKRGKETIITFNVLLPLIYKFHAPTTNCKRSQICYGQGKEEGGGGGGGGQDLFSYVSILRHSLGNRLTFTQRFEL